MATNCLVFFLISENDPRNTQRFNVQPMALALASSCRKVTPPSRYRRQGLVGGEPVERRGGDGTRAGRASRKLEGMGPAPRTFPNNRATLPHVWCNPG